MYVVQCKGAIWAADTLNGARDIAADISVIAESPALVSAFGSPARHACDWLALYLYEDGRIIDRPAFHHNGPSRAIWATLPTEVRED